MSNKYDKNNGEGICKECKGEQLIQYSPSMGMEYCKTCNGSGTTIPH